MKKENTKFKKGQILVATRDIVGNCGSTLIHGGELVEVVDPVRTWSGMIFVYRGIKNKEIDRDYKIHESYFDEATPEQEKMYFEGKRNINGEVVC